MNYQYTRLPDSNYVANSYISKNSAESIAALSCLNNYITEISYSNLAKETTLEERSTYFQGLISEHTAASGSAQTEPATLSECIHLYKGKYSALFDNVQGPSLLRLKDAYAEIARQLIKDCEQQPNAVIEAPLAAENSTAYVEFVRELRKLPLAKKYESIQNWLKIQVTKAEAKLTPSNVFVPLNGQTSPSSSINISFYNPLSPAAKKLTAAEYTTPIDAFVAKYLLTEMRKDEANASAQWIAGATWRERATVTRKSLCAMFLTPSADSAKVKSMNLSEKVQYRVGMLAPLLTIISAILTSIIFYQMAGRATTEIKEETGISFIDVVAFALIAKLYSAIINGAVGYFTTDKILPAANEPPVEKVLVQWTQPISKTIRYGTSSFFGLFFVIAIAVPNIDFTELPLADNVLAIISAATDFFNETYGSLALVTLVSELMVRYSSVAPRAIQETEQIGLISQLIKKTTHEATITTNHSHATKWGRNVLSGLLALLSVVVVYGANGFPFTGAQEFTADIYDDSSEDAYTKHPIWIFFAAIMSIPGMGLPAIAAYSLSQQILTGLSEKSQPTPLRQHYPLSYWSTKLGTYASAFLFSGFSNGYLNLLFARRTFDNKIFRMLQIGTGILSANINNAVYGAEVCEKFVNLCTRLWELLARRKTTFNQALNEYNSDQECGALLEEFIKLQTLIESKKPTAQLQEIDEENQVISEEPGCFDGFFDSSPAEQALGFKPI